MAKPTHSCSRIVLALAISAALVACSDGGGRGGVTPTPTPTPSPSPSPNPNPQPNAPGDTFAITSANRLVTFNRTGASQAVQTATNITGLMAGDTIIGFDVRPQNGNLLAVTLNGTTGRIYTIDPATAAASTPVTISVALDGSNFGVDFNPVPDRLRIVSDTGQNLRINVSDGSTTTDGTLTLAGATKTGITATSYTNSFANACRTTLYYIDTAASRLLSTSNPNAGVLTDIGPLGLTGSALSGFEIVTASGGNAPSNTAFSVLTSTDTATLYTIDLSTGAATAGGTISGLNSGETIVGIGIAPPTTAPAQALGELLGVTETNRLFSFNSAAPGKLCTGPTAITGLADGTSIIGIDVRPADGRLYAVGLIGTTGSIYIVDPVSGIAAASPQTISAAVTGNAFGIDFNPVPDRLRLVSDTGRNLRINADNGAATVDLDINPAGSMVTAAAYTNSFGPAAPATTKLYTIDSTAGTLNLQDPPNDGRQVPVGSLGITGGITGVNGFDINGVNNTAIAALTVGGASSSTLYTINLTSGAATALAGGNIGTGATPALAERVRGITLSRNPQVTLTGVTAGNQLVTFSATTPGTFSSSVAITGLQGGENIVGADFRPANGVLNVVTDAARVYTVNTTSGAASLLSTFVADAGDTSLPFSSATFTAGMAFGVDFNPVPDRLRTVSAANQLNLRSAVDTGATFTDGLLNRAALTPALMTPQATSVAYSNSLPGMPLPTATTLFVVDAANDRLFVQNPPNDGSLVNVGLLGIDATSTGGFDIVGPSTALAVLSTASTANGLYSINLGTGAATLVAAIGAGAGDSVTGFAAPPSAMNPAANSTAYAVINGTQLVSFARNAPATLLSSVAITGLAGGETLRDIDFRPAQGALYGFGTLGGVYTIGLNGVATAQAALAGTGYTGPVGTRFGIDFNPVPDRLRIVSDGNQNLRINVDTGATTVDGAINALTPAPSAVAAAYTNSFAPTPTATMLYVIDTATGALQLQNPPNDGTLTQVGRLDPIFSFTTSAGFDIVGGDNGLALAVLQPTGATQSTLYRINLTTGLASPVGTIGPATSPALVGAFAIRLQ